MPSVLEEDLDKALSTTGELWPSLKFKRIFLSGGSGFFGCWLMELLLHASNRLDLGTQVTILTRDPSAFQIRCPHLAAHKAVTLHEGDVMDFTFPHGDFDMVIHAAGETSNAVALNHQNPAALFDIAVSGTRRMLEFSLARGVKRFLFTSTGGIYGDASAFGALTPEAALSAPDPLSPWSALTEGKRAAECLCACAGASGLLEVVIARCFSFMGPYSPLDSHFAAGNFLRQALDGTPIIVKGDGRAVRSYLYGSDLATWLWTLLCKGRPGTAYNVGSEDAVTIEALARLIAEKAGGSPEVRILGASSPGVAPSRYVPSTARARSELGLGQSVPLEVAVERTLRWLREVR